MTKIKALGMLAVVLLLYGCSADSSGRGSGNAVETEGTAQEDTAGSTYKFVDVKGAEYEAACIEGLPLCSYDYGRLKEEDGFKYYTDKDGSKISRTGIDVSEFQQPVDWNKVSAAGIEFAMVRVGYRGYGNAGKLVEDKMFRPHMDGALGAGLDVGVYFFPRQYLGRRHLRRRSSYWSGSTSMTLHIRSRLTRKR